MSESLSSTTPTSWNSNPWVTAKVVEAQRVHRYICRLDTLGYDYQVVCDNHQIRILVRRESLEEVLDWFGDLSAEWSTKPRSTDARAATGVLIALPTGMLLGNVFCRFVGVSDQLASSLSGYCGLAAAGLVYVVLVSRSKR